MQPFMLHLFVVKHTHVYYNIIARRLQLKGGMVMKQIVNFLVKKRYIVFGAFLFLSLLSSFFISRVTINNDLTAYLPADSPTKLGVELHNEEFGVSSTMRIVFEHLDSETEQTIFSDLNDLSDVTVEFEHSPAFVTDEQTLFILHLPYESTSNEAKHLLDTIEATYPDAIFGGEIFVDNQPMVPTYIIVVAVVILLIILFIFTSSWIEPLLFILTIGLAIVLNLGTNVIFDSISTITFSIAALLQLSLSIDYSIILMNRYRQERVKNNSITAMRNALTLSFSAIIGSSLTTIVGLLCLVFMSFRIGSDLGYVLAKGVLFSMLSVFFVLPTLIIWTDTLIKKTSKKSLHTEAKPLATFSNKYHIIVPILFVGLFIFSLFMRGSTNTSFKQPVTSIDQTTEQFDVYDEIVVLYANDDESQIPLVLNELTNEDNIQTITSYATTLGAPLTAEQLAGITGIDINLIHGMFLADGITALSIDQFITTLLNNYSFMLTPEQLGILQAIEQELDTQRSLLVSDSVSRMILTLDSEPESTETNAVLNNLTKVLDQELTSEYHLIGESVMAREVSNTFDAEFLLVTILTISSIFIVVLITFRSIIIPFILVLIIQTAIYTSIGVLNYLSTNIYFLIIFVVQAILMGATIDYGILFTTYYRTGERSESTLDTLKRAYKGSVHSILTSSTILFTITGILGLVSTEPIIAQVLRALAVGTLTATLLILFVLPAVLTLADKLIRKS